MKKENGKWKVVLKQNGKFIAMTVMGHLNNNKIMNNQQNKRMSTISAITIAIIIVISSSSCFSYNTSVNKQMQ